MKLSLDLCRNVLEYGTTKLILHEKSFVVNHMTGSYPAPESYRIGIADLSWVWSARLPFCIALAGPRYLAPKTKNPGCLCQGLCRF